MSKDEAAFIAGLEKMIETDIKGRGIADEAVIRALKAVPRHIFVPENYRGFYYGDFPLPIGFGQTISQPYIVALMTQSLALDKNCKVLEIGTGSGYQTAVIARLAGEIHSVELIPELHNRAKSLLLNMQTSKNIWLYCGDGYDGLPEQAPFDRIILTAAPAEIPDALVDQLAEGGRMVVPYGEGFQRLSLIEKKPGGRIIETFIESVRFVPMVRAKRERK